MYGDVFCKVYNELGWNVYPEVFAEDLLLWLERNQVKVEKAMDLACGTGILCRILQQHGISSAGMDFSEGMIAVARQNAPQIPFEVADMVTFCPREQYDLVTCTGDALNHIPSLSDVGRIFSNISRYLKPGGYLIFDILNQHEGEACEPFEVDFGDSQRIWFQMSRPAEGQVHLQIRLYEHDVMRFEENIRETVHDPAVICRMLEGCGFTVLRCADRLLDERNPSTTWYVVARKGVGPNAGN